MKYLIISLLFLSGCTLFTEEVIKEVPVHAMVECASPPLIQPLDMRPVNWQLATKDNATVLALDGQNYSNLGMNFERIVEYIQVQKLITRYYIECIEAHNKKGEQ